MRSPFDTLADKLESGHTVTMTAEEKAVWDMIVRGGVERARKLFDEAERSDAGGLPAMPISVGLRTLDNASDKAPDKAPDEDAPILLSDRDVLPLTSYPLGRGLRCSVCRLSVYRNPGGFVCENGHGGAEEEGIPDRPAFDIVEEENWLAVEAEDQAREAVFDPEVAFLPAEEIARLDAEAGWVASEDQRTGLDTLVSVFSVPGVYVLTGAAGSGKTTLVKALLRRLSKAWDILLLAPTWRAANRLRQVTERPTMTIHRAVYGKPVEERQCAKCQEWSEDLTEPQDVEVEVTDPDAPPVKVKLPRYLCPSCKEAHVDATRFPERLTFVLKESGGGEEGEPPLYRLVLIDEWSMVSQKVARDIVAAFPGARILCVGDANQLPPVEEEVQIDGAAPGPIIGDLLNPTVALHKVHRQAEGNPVLGLAHQLKVTPEMSKVEWPFPRSLRGVHIETKVPLDVPARWAASLRHQNEDLALIALSNKTRAQLNNLVRHYTGALAFAQYHNATVIPGDRLLARGNGDGVYNGEIWTVCSIAAVEPGTCMLNEQGRAYRRYPSYEHDRALEEGVAVLRVEIAMVGGESVRLNRYIVAPRDGLGRPMLESDLILAGVDPGKARARCNTILRTWKAEYNKAVDDHQKEFETRQANALDKRICVAKLVAANGNRSVVARAFQMLGKAGVDSNFIAAFRDRESFVESDFEPIWNVYDVAAECSDAQMYCERVYGALRAKEACQFDFGECLTAHAMQGSAAKHVGVVFDSAFWGMWRNDRKAALQWAYTSLTRTTDHLALFGIARAS